MFVCLFVVIVVAVVVYLWHFRTELIHKYLMLQQERDLIARKLDQSKELVDNLYISLEGYSELQQSFSETQESNLLQQEIVRHLQERAVR